MGQENTKILTRCITPHQLVRKEPVQVSLYFYPFKQYSECRINEDTQEVTLSMVKPYEDLVKVAINFYPELEKALFEKTFDIRIEQVLFDTFNFDKVFYIGWDHKTPITFVQRKFKQFESQLYKNILYEKHIYETINRLLCPNLIKLNDSFCINSNLEEERPLTFFFVFESLEVSLSEIIKYRRGNNCEWYVSEFQKLCWDLVCAVDQLHQANIVHNDIRPCNVFYSTEKQCYVLGEYASALKTDPNGTFLNVRTRTHPSFMIPEKELSTDGLKEVFINHKRADIYALGITLLCAFYMTQPVERKLAAPVNRDMEQKYSIIKTIRKMVNRSLTPVKIEDLKRQLQKCNKDSQMNYLIRSIKFRQKPKTKQLPMMFITYASAYKRLGLWDRWRKSLQTAYQTAQGNITTIQEALYCKELSRVEKLLENHNKADELGQKAARLYYEVGSRYMEDSNFTEAFNALNKGMKALDYCINSNKIVLVKILQSLSILYFEENQQVESLACLKESKKMLKMTYSESIEDYYEIKSQQARIHQVHMNFQDAEKVLKQLLEQAKRQKDFFQQIEFLKQLGINSIKKGQISNKSNKKIDADQLKISSPLRRSKVMKKVEFQNQDSQQIEKSNKSALRGEHFLRAEQYFKEGSQLLLQKLSTITSKTGFIRRKTINKDENELQDAEIEYENLLTYNLLILKHMGEIKFKENETERAEDYFYKILAEIDKLFNTQSEQLLEVNNVQIDLDVSPEKEIPKNKRQLQRMLTQESDSRKNDFDFQTITNKKIGKNSKSQLRDQSTKPLTIITQKARPKRVLSKGQLTKMKADIQCSIALCKQQSDQYQQMLGYYNKSLSSYKSYYGQFHNKLCGIIIGSMALGYQKVNQHNKAMECIQLATEILRDIEPFNSPDLRHFERVRLRVLKEERMVEKRLIDRKNLQIAHNVLAEILSSTLGLKRRQRRKTTLKKKFSIYSNVSSVDFNNNDFAQPSQIENLPVEVQEEGEYEGYDSDNSSIREIELPLEVTYARGSNNRIKEVEDEEEEQEVEESEVEVRVGGRDER